MKRRFGLTTAGAAAMAAMFAAAFVAEAALAQAAEFVGSKACMRCHKEEHQSWQKTLHSKMVLPMKEGLLKDAGDAWEKDAKGTPGPTKGNVTGAAAKMDDVVFVVGTNWKQRYLIKDPTTGGHQFMDKQWNRMTKAWEGYGQKNTWETQCTTCHTTGFRLTAYDASNPKAQKWEYAEANIGCEACHGPGSVHAKSKKKADIYTFAGKSRAEQSKVCGYCHIRLENDQFKTAQGAASEYLPHPTVGQSYKAGEDWTKWYPDHVAIPVVNPKYPADKEWEAGDLKGLFKLDEQSKKTGIYDAAKHHQQYQEYLQSTHYKKDVASCSDCHSSHSSKDKPAKVAADTCKSAGCHDASFTVEKYMPGTGQTAAGLFVRTHTFNKDQARPKTLTATGTPEFFYKK
jgi:hypothetical protein